VENKDRILFESERCQYREFGVYADGTDFAGRHPQLLADIKKHDLNYLMSEAYPRRQALSSAIQQLPEYLAFLKTTLKTDFFFAAFRQSDKRGDDPDVKRTGQKDVEMFVLERIQDQHEDPRKNYEFVVETGNRVIGYVELFDEKPCEAGLQYERGIFINADEQANGYGKEAIIALTDYAFRVLSVNRIFTMADPENVRSVNNITKNSGGVQVGEEDSKYSHLNGGGSRRALFHIRPEGFYKAVEEKGNQGCLMKAPETPAAWAVKYPVSRKPLPSGRPAKPTGDRRS